MGDHERTITCPDGKTVTLMLQSQVVLIYRSELQTNPLDGQNLAVGWGRPASFRCSDCQRIFGCRGQDGLSDTQKIEIFIANSGHRYEAIAREAFQTFFFDMDVTQKPVIPTSVTPL